MLMAWIVSPSPQFIVEAPAFNVAVFGDTGVDTFRKVIKVIWGHKDGILIVQVSL